MDVNFPLPLLLVNGILYVDTYKFFAKYFLITLLQCPKLLIKYCDINGVQDIVLLTVLVLILPVQPQDLLLVMILSQWMEVKQVFYGKAEIF